jgi:hypothetical protein
MVLLGLAGCLVEQVAQLVAPRDAELGVGAVQV